ncbi:MAG: AAA family ATPase [Syntrophobacteraceae bacterium]
MYLSYYGFSREPFQMAPDPAFLFPSPGHRRALDVIRRGLENRAGLMMIAGGEGLGKTTVIRSATQLLAADNIRSIVVLNPRLSYGELLRVIYAQLELDFPEREEQFELLRRLQQVLVKEHQAGRNIALFIDEAQEMPADTLENLRLLSDMELGRDKLVQIVLAGKQPDLERQFESFDLRQLKQRIAYRATLVNLTAGESVEYIKHRVHCALETGIDGPFTLASIEAIARHCRGVPSRINIVCRGVLAAGSAMGVNPITPGVVARVIADLEGPLSKPWLKWAMAPAALLLLGALVPLIRSTDHKAPSAIEARQSAREANTLPVITKSSPLPPTPPRVETQQTMAENAERSVRPEKLDDTPASRDARSEGSTPAVTMAHPPKALSPGLPEAGPKIDTPLAAPHRASQPLPAPQEKNGMAARTAATPGIPSSARGQPAQGAPKSPPPPPASSIRQSRERAPGPPLSTSEPGKRAVSPPARSPQQATAGKEKPQPGRNRPDPSAIIDWFIEKRATQE